MDKCDLHTILRLPTGIFYAAGVKTNVLFFERGKTETKNTKKVWFYDMRTNGPSYGKRTAFSRTAFGDFVKAYTGGIELDGLVKNYDGKIDHKKRDKIEDKRWTSFTREELAERNDTLDVGLSADDNYALSANQIEPIQLAQEAKNEITAIMKELDSIIKELS